MKIFIRALCCAIACAGLTGTAQAGLKDIYNSNNSGEVEIGFQRQKYGETVDNESFDYERGTIPNFGFGLNYMPHGKYSSWLMRNLYVSLHGDFGLGSTDYTGGLCSGSSCIPWTTTTENNIFTFSGRIGHGFPLGQHVMLVPYGDIGFRMWTRKITGVGGYTEDYNHGSFMAGVLAQVSPAERWVIGLGAAGGTTFAAAMKTQGINYELGAESIWRMEGRVGYRVTKHLELTAKGEFSGFGYGRSPLAEDGSYEPDSYTHNLRTSIGLAYQFAP